jgi:hypothetical protein
MPTLYNFYYQKENKMEFTLFYEGKLKAKRDIKHKQEIRRELHKQIAQIWESDFFKMIRKNLIERNIMKEYKCKEFNFLPIVSKLHRQVALLNIFILWPDYPGSVITNKGDVDNRLKTLLDALRMPQNENEIPKDDFPRNGEEIFYCLLEDDKLISKLSITTDRLLYPTSNESEVKFFINVKISSSTMDYDDAAYAY